MSSSLSHLHLHIALPQEVRLHLGEMAGTNGVAEVVGGELEDVGSGDPASYALVGEGVPLLTAEQRNILADTASLLAGETVRVVALPAGRDGGSDSGVMAEPENPEPEVKPEAPPVIQPIPVTRRDFHKFAMKHGYSRARAGRAWCRVYYTARKDSESEEDRTLPAIRYLGVRGCPHYRNRGDAILDLRSVQERLVASGGNPGAWDEATTGDVEFLGYLAREGL